MRQGGGHIINIGSIAGHDVYPGGNVYCATKHAVRALTASLRLDLNGTGVRVSAVALGTGGQWGGRVDQGAARRIVAAALDLLAQERWTITGLSKVKQPDYASIQQADLIHVIPSMETAT